MVDKFYEFMLADPVVSHFFAKTDMEKQRKSQTAFIAMATGGGNHYTGQDMKTAHKNMKIGSKEFDATWGHLEQALKHFKVGEGLITEVKDVFYSVE